MRWITVLLGAALLTAACSGGGGTAPDARHLAGQITGCRHFVTQTPDVLASGDVTCDPPGAGALGSIEVATFTSMRDERQWIRNQASQASCCIEGTLWAADYAYTQVDEFPLILKALGGRQVTG